MFDWLKEFPNLINVFAIIIGWLIINRQNNHRETRKEIRASLNEIQEIISDLEAKGILYHTEKRSIKDEILISSKVNLLSKKIQLTVPQLKVDNPIELINNYKTSLTNEENFAAEHRPLDADADFLLNIRKDAQELSLHLEDTFVKCYHKGSK